MACDLTTQRRRKHWQGLESENALPLASTGYRNNGALARQYWCEFPTTQTDSQWLWLNDGFVLTNQSPLPLPGSTGRFVYDDISELQSADLNCVGLNEIDYGNESGFTIEWVVTLLNLDLIGGDPISLVISFAISLTPSVLHQIVIPNFINVIPIAGGDPQVLGGAILTPLKPCHDCTPT